MALVLADRVKETTTTTGTGTITLLGAVSGFQSFATIGNGNTTYYAIVGQTTTEWEVGLGTYTSSGTTLARTTVYASSNSNNAVTFSAGTKDVFVTLPSSVTTPSGSIVTFAGVNINAGTATQAPIDLTAGVNLTTPSAGAIEYDGSVFYSTPIANNRALSVTEHFVTRTGTKTMTSNTTLQAVFGGGTGALTNGALTVAASTSYFFECSLNLNTMSGTSGNMGFSIGGAGTATFTSAAWHSFGFDATTQTTASATGYGGIWSNAQAQTGNIVLASTGTACSVYIKGIFRINGTGTIIPSVQLTTAAAAIIGVDSWFKCYPVGTNTIVSVGNWS